MASFNNRVFGSNIDPKVRNKLRARQVFAESSKGNILSSVQMKDVDSAGNELINGALDMVSEIGERNFNGSNTGDSLFELGSRTPWVRMWTGVQFYHFEKGGQVGDTEYEKIKVGTKIDYSGVLVVKVPVYAEQTKKKMKKDVTTPLKGTIYQLGNNEYNLFSKNDSISSIFESKDDYKNLSSGTLSTATSIKDSLSGKYLYGEGSNNEFMKPGAGITSVNSSTDGPMGAIKRTNVSFIVHNFYDYENIYQRYFLKPGALVVVDFGWDTSHIYNPSGVLENEGSFIDALFSEDGKVEKSKGDLEIVIGYVTDFDSKVNEDGSFECSLEITSASEGLLDKQISDRNGIKNKFVNGIVPYLVNKASYLNGNNWQFLRKNWADNSDTLEASKNFADKFASTAFGSYGEDIDIGEQSLTSGIYFQSYSEKDDSVNSTDGKLYVSWGFFEDEMLNSELKLKYGDNIDFGAEFNSQNTYISYDVNLLLRQNIPAIFTSNKNLLKFLYPDIWVNTYSVKNKKTPIYRDEFFVGYTLKEMVKLERDNFKKMPLRELFIDVEIIKEAFNTNNSINDAIKQILDTLNENSYNVFNLKLTVSSNDDSTLSVVNENAYISDEFKDIMTFSPYSKGSIVKSISLNYSTPKNDIQNMIAIQGTGVEYPISIDGLDQDIYQTLRMINGMSSDDFNKSIGIRNIPTLDNNKLDKENDLYRYEYNFEKPDTRLLYGDDNSKSIMAQYDSIFNELSENVQEELLESNEYKGLDEFEIDVDKDVDEKVPETEEDDGIDEGVVYVNTIEEYFGKKALARIIEDDSISPIIPYTLNLGIYGISSLFPGDIFTVDYLPSYYRDSVYFQITKVSHEVTTEGWTTNLESQMKMRPAKRIKELYKQPKTFLHPKYFDGKLCSALKGRFKNFDITTKGTDNILVITGVAKKDKNFGIEMDGNFTSYDKDIIRGFIGRYFSPGSSLSKKTVEDVKYSGGYLRDQSTHTPLKYNHQYHMIVFSGGAFVFEKWDEDYLSTIDAILKHARGKTSVRQRNINYEIEPTENPCDMCSEFYNNAMIDDMNVVQQKKYCQETLGKNKHCVYTDNWGPRNTCEPVEANCQ